MATTPVTVQPGSITSQVRKSYPAGFFSRMEAFILDLVFLIVLQIGGAGLVQAILRFFRHTRLVAYLKTAWENSPYNFAIGTLILALFTIGYFIFFWTMFGFTPGKAVLGLKVVRKDGRNLSVFRSLVRFFSYWISALPFFLGFLWVLWDPNRRGWHDKIAGTQVVYTPKYSHKITQP